MDLIAIMLKVKSTTLRRFGGFTIKFDYIHSLIPPPNFDTSTICRLSAETLIHKAYWEAIFPLKKSLECQKPLQNIEKP